MQILAASVARSAETFLHAGYLSAYPRPMRFFSFYFEPTRSTVELDVAGALRLTGESLGQAGGGGAETAAAGTIGSLQGWPVLLLIVLSFFLGLSLAYRIRDRRMRRLVLFIPILGGAMLLAYLEGGKFFLPTTVPWKDVELKEYVDPERATLALLHGIIADGIINIGQPVKSLANIQNEVGLPVRNPTEGEAYALKTYGIDGWGHPFRLRREGEKYHVASAGRDGEFDTGDDIQITLRQCGNESWEFHRHAFFIRKVGFDHLIFFHRWTGRHFLYRNRKWAQALTGGELFDVVSPRDLETGRDKDARSARLREMYNRVSEGLDHEPLVLQVFPRSI